MKEKKPIGLSTKIFISLLLGAVFGLCINFFLPSGVLKNDILINGILYIVGNGFIRLMQMLVIPLVMCSLICGTMSIGDTKTLGKVGLKTLGFYIATTAIAISLALSPSIKSVFAESFDATICTFHSLCAKILRREIDVLGYDKSFSIIDEDEQLNIFEVDINKASSNDTENTYKIPRMGSDILVFVQNVLSKFSGSFLSKDGEDTIG